MSIEKRYANDSVKSKSRDMLRTSIEDTILQYKKPTQVKVVCLPGIDAQEIIEVYDPLGIPRKNIVGIEMMDDVHSELQKKDLGIQLYHGTVNDYVKSQRQIYQDVVSFDYTGPVNDEQIDSLYLLGKRQILEKFLYFSLNLARRDTGSRDIYAKSVVDIDSNISLENSRNFIDYHTSGMRDYMDKIEDLLSDNNLLYSQRSDAYSKLIQDAMISISKDQSPKLLKFLFKGESSRENISHFVEKLKINDKLKNLTDNEILSIGLNSDEFFNFRIPYIEYLFMKKLSLTRSFTSEEINFEAPSLGHLFQRVLESRKDQRVTYSSRFSYVSESGSPMFGDINFFNLSSKRLKRGQKLIKYLGYPHNFKLKNKNEYFNLTCKYLGLLGTKNDFKVSYDYNLSERVDLGSSSRPVLSKKRFLDEIKTGLTDEEIKLKYRGWKNKEKSFAAWRAHNTMGTYQNEEKTKIEKNEKIKLPKKKIVKDGRKIEIISYLKDGIPDEEIVELFPDVSMRSLAAYRAHITMGTY